MSEAEYQADISAISADRKVSSQDSSGGSDCEVHSKDASNAFKAALQAFGVTWERKNKGVEKIPA